MIKRLLVFTLFLALTLPFFAHTTNAQGTLLPEGNGASIEDCNKALDDVAGARNFFMSSDAETQRNYLACAVKTGKVRLWMLPYFVSYIVNFFIYIAGIISLLFVVLGGFWYMAGGITDDKEKGKKTIFYALVGLVLTLLAWIIVNVIQVQVTN